MWIRSQDKKMLVDASYIEVCQGAKRVYWEIINQHAVSLGEYDTESDAMKVMDMIQDGLPYDRTRIFQMPTREELHPKIEHKRVPDLGKYTLEDFK